MSKQRFFPKIPVQLVSLIASLLLGAPISFSEEPLVLQADQDGVQRAKINMESYVYSPNKLVVDLGKPVELTLENNSFLVPHNFLLDSPDGERLVEEDISSGEIETVQFTLTTSGTYPFYCDKQLLFFPNHREEGMEGTIVVR
ncbi:MAG: cupredoxin domain-containing protein [Nitrospirota bacterium]|nr:MAG: cupredoxin domain-containing protein [Nitrospirota bacterium]